MVGHKNLLLLNFNANGVKNQTYELQQLLNKYDIDIACITETHLQPNTKFKICNYKIHRTDRLQRNGGGTAIIIKSNIPHRRAILPQFNILEATGVYINFDNTELLVTSVYHPPYLQMNEPDMTSLVSVHNNFVCCGDFNAKNTAWNSRITTPKGQFLLDHSIKHHYAIAGPLMPTRYPWSQIHKPDVLDICLYKTNTIPTNQQCLTALDSDHIPILITINKPITKYEMKNVIAKTTNWDEYTKQLHESIPVNLRIF